MSVPPINLDTTLGAVFIGNIVAAIENTRDGRAFKQLNQVIITFLFITILSIVSRHNNFLLFVIVGTF
ncbi:hypothetical protein CVT25_000570 [Psilocybe cyanescens]|uniref:Uncharacterized protein n=1 Tax=Psilocybe cyanescens TaxID=93625 RepID=A0A409WZR6_PSICY|nr:hypothetical protein CVT25_000570 [Psilocybe cyanescens]